MKLRKIAVFVSFGLVFMLGGILTACKDSKPSSSDSINSEVYSEGVIVGGENVLDESLVYNIENAHDIHVRKNEDISVYTAKVTAVCGNDSKAVTVDLSKVDVTKSGRYTLTYSYATAVKEVSVYVYDTPQITDSKAGQVISTTYRNAYQDIFDGLTANVTCGDEKISLEIKLETRDFIRVDGSIDISRPSRTLNFMAESPSGEVVRIAREILVTGGMVEPTLEAAYTYDVFDDSLIIKGLEQESIDNFLTVSIDEKTVFPLVKVENNQIIIEGQGLYELLGVSEAHTLRVVTSNGYAEASLEVVDEKPVLLDVSKVKNFISSGKINGQTYALPAALLKNNRQTADINFRLIKNEQTLTDKIQDVTLDGIGTYILEYTVRGMTSRFEFICYNDLGLQGNVTFTMEKKFDFQLPEGYQLLSYTVREKAGIVAYYSLGNKEYNDLEEFYQQVAGLNKSKTYQLEVCVKSENKLLSQTIDFTIGDSRITEILTGENSLDLGKVTTHSSCTLEYVVSELGDRNGGYKWYFPTDEMGQTDSLLHFDDITASQMKKGMFITFDIYCTSPLNLSWYDATDVTGFYTDHYNAAHSPKISYYVDGIRYTNLKSMNEIPDGYLNRWITIELELTRDFAVGDEEETAFNNTWNGLFVIGNFSNLHDYDNYVANIKLSEYSFMQDQTQNKVFEPNKESEGTHEDIWQD